MNARTTRPRLRGLLSFVLLPSILVAVPSCGGGDAEAGTSTASSSGGATAASGGGASSGGDGWEGMWKGEKGKLVLITGDGRFASFHTQEAVDDLRFHELGENEYGETTIPTQHRTAGWELEGNELVSYKRSKKPEEEGQRFEYRRLRRLTPQEWSAYWKASAWRLVRNGKLDEIRAAEADGFSFAGVVDPAITQAAEGQNVFVDMVTYAVEEKQRHVAEHFLAQGFEVYSPKASEAAVEMGDPELLGTLLDHGLSADDTLKTAILEDAPAALFEVLFEKGATPKADHLELIDRMMIENKSAVRPLFESRLGG